MSASQLLRILQTLPAGADDEICDFNTEELEGSVNRTSRCTNPFLADEKDRNSKDSQVDFWNNRPELECSTFGNEFTKNHEDETFRKSPAVCNVQSHLLPNTTGFRIDKHLVESELPEFIVCYKESDFHVKDICIEEETVSVHKDDNHEFLYNSVPVINGDDHNDMIEASLDTEFLKHEWLRSSTMACCYTDELDSSVQNHCAQKMNLSTSLQDDVSTDLQDWSLTPLEFPVSSNIYDGDINQHSLQGSKDELGKSFVNQQEVVYGNKTGVKNHETRYVEGESSFSMAGVISELISCSRPMPFAGGISTRSDSSATSTRSFAFPTLETEYTSSPARMGKVERKRLEKQRRWRKGLICCKF